MNHGQASALKAGADGGLRAEAFPGPAQDVLGGLLVEAHLQRLDFRWGKYGVDSLQISFSNRAFRQDPASRDQNPKESPACVFLRRGPRAVLGSQHVRLGMQHRLYLRAPLHSWPLRADDGSRPDGNVEIPPHTAALSFP